jgi:hypothetical protein
MIKAEEWRKLAPSPLWLEFLHHPNLNSVPVSSQFPSTVTKNTLRPDKQCGSEKKWPLYPPMCLLPPDSSPCHSTPPREPTFEGIIKVLLPKDHPKVMNGTGVELHTKDDVSGWAPELLVVALQLEGKKTKNGGSGPREPPDWLH